MAEFINTIDVLGDEVVLNSIVDRSITEFKDDQLTAIADYAFYACAALTDVNLTNVTSVSGNAFASCASLKNVNIPLLTKINGSVFANCSSLESISFSSVTSLAGRAFSKCTYLTNIDLPLVTSLGGWTFEYCSGMESVCLPALKTVGSSDFDNCTNLKKADFPSATKVGATFSFRYCSSLIALVLRNATLCALGGTTQSNFGGTPIASGTGYVYVPRALIEDYKVATNWSTIANQFRALEDYTVDGTITGDLDESKI